MELSELDRWADEFEAFHSRFSSLFGRREVQQQAVKYVQGLVSPVERKNGWQLAEAVGDKRPDATQRLLYKTKWDAEAVRDALQRFVIEGFGDAEGIGVVDETGFLKKGAKSAGVQRQYSGTAGKVENCQLGVFLTYATTQGHTFLDGSICLRNGVRTESAVKKRKCLPTSDLPPSLNWRLRCCAMRGGWVCRCAG